MPGAQLQIVSYNESGSDMTNTQPQITYFKNVYKHYENFSIETIPIRFNKFNRPDWSSPMEFQSKIDNIGHLLQGLSLNIQIPLMLNDDTLKPRWIDDLGLNVIKEATLFIGGEPINTVSGDWLNIYYKRYIPYEKYIQSKELINPSESPLAKKYLNSESTLSVKLPFLWDKGSALPLYNIEYQSIYVKVIIRPISEWITIIEQNENSPYYGKRVKCHGEYNEQLNKLVEKSGFFDFLLTANVVYLEEERFKQLRRTNFEFLIEQNIEVISPNIIDDIVIMNINQRPSTKELWIIAQRTDVASRNAWNDYSPWDSWKTRDGELNIPYNMLNSEYTPTQFLQQYWQDYYTVKEHVPKASIINNMTMYLDEKVFINERDSQYMSLASTIDKGFMFNDSDYLYHCGFSLNPLKFQPSGMLNLDRTSKVQIKIMLNQSPPKRPYIWMNPATNMPYEPADTEYKPWLNVDDLAYGYNLKIIFVSYNILKVQNGMADLVFRK